MSDLTINEIAAFLTFALMLALLLVLLLAEPPFLRTDKAKAYILRSPRRQS